MAQMSVKVWGDYACFTRPEMKVERVTYATPTPSAARGMLEAIFWKPEVTWVVEQIDVLKRIRYVSVLRNEVKSRQSAVVARRWASAGGGYSVEADRTQRHTLALRDVAYIIRARMEVRAHAGADIAKYQDQFRRRVRRGQCFTIPYLGCREFAAFFGEEDPAGEQAIPEDADLGRMLHDVCYDAVSGRAEPVFFDAVLERGTLRVPSC